MSTTWIPKRVGNWLFHCHFTMHMMPTHFSRRSNGSHDELSLPHPSREASAPGHLHGNHATEGMGGMVMGIQVGPGPDAESDDGVTPERQLRLIAAARPDGPDGAPRYGYLLQDPLAPQADEPPQSPGPTIILTKGVPTEIKVLNALNVPTTVHWHGLELDSYFDGIADWSGDDSRLAPLIAPGDSFSVLVRPVRAGTFIYHSHVDEAIQLALGLYGAIVILEPGQSFDADRDRVFVFGQDGVTLPEVVNGLVEHEPAFLKLGTSYRIRLVGITANSPRMARIRRNDVLDTWRAVAKDGADLPPSLVRDVAAETLLDVGETRDFVYTPTQLGEAILMFEDFVTGTQPDIVIPLRIHE